MNNPKQSFWHTAPGLLTATAALITALTGAYLAVASGKPNPDPLVPTADSSAPKPASDTKSSKDAVWTQWDMIASDDFEQASAWPDRSYTPDNRYKRFVVGRLQGKYKMELSTDTDWWGYPSAPYGAATDFHAAVDASIAESTFGKRVLVGIVFGLVEGSAYYVVLRSDGDLELTRQEGDQNLLLHRPIPTQVDPRVGVRLGVVVEGDLIQVLANGKFVTEVRDPRYRGGQVSLVTGTAEAADVVTTFDNFEFRRKPR